MTSVRRRPSSYSYDNNGSVTARGSDSFTWDSANRLTAATVSGVDPQTMTYNGDGLRQTRTDTTTHYAWNYVWDVGARLPVVLDDDSQYVYGLGLVAQVWTGSTTFYFLSDGLGSTLAMVAGDGTLVQSYSYDVYGTPTAGTNRHPAEYNFAGQQTDPTNLQYLRARYFDPASGRFLSRDPSPQALSDILGRPSYVYAGGNPASVSDPSGLCGLDEAGNCTLITMPDWLAPTCLGECTFDPGPGGSSVYCPGACTVHFKGEVNVRVTCTAQCWLVTTKGEVQWSQSYCSASCTTKGEAHPSVAGCLVSIGTTVIGVGATVVGTIIVLGSDGILTIPGGWVMFGGLQITAAGGAAGVATCS